MASQQLNSSIVRGYSITASISVPNDNVVDSAEWEVVSDPDYGYDKRALTRTGLIPGAEAPLIGPWRCLTYRVRPQESQVQPGDLTPEIVIGLTRHLSNRERAMVLRSLSQETPYGVSARFPGVNNNNQGGGGNSTASNQERGPATMQRNPNVTVAERTASQAFGRLINERAKLCRDNNISIDLATRVWPDGLALIVKTQVLELEQQVEDAKTAFETLRAERLAAHPQDQEMVDAQAPGNNNVANVAVNNNRNGPNAGRGRNRGSQSGVRRPYGRGAQSGIAGYRGGPSRGRGGQSY